MKTLNEIFKEAREFPYPDDFDFSKLKLPKSELKPFDRIKIFSKDEVEFLKEEGLWDDPDFEPECQEGIILPHPDTEERSNYDYEAVICIKTPCPKEGIFYDYISLGQLVTSENFHSITKQ